jgi:hypothetical protein
LKIHWGIFNVLAHSAHSNVSSLLLSSSQFLLQQLIYFKNIYEFEAPVEARSAFTVIVCRCALYYLDVSST